MKIFTAYIYNILNIFSNILNIPKFLPNLTVNFLACFIARYWIFIILFIIVLKRIRIVLTLLWCWNDGSKINAASPIMRKIL